MPGAFILKSEILGGVHSRGTFIGVGHLFEGGVYSRGGIYFKISKIVETFCKQV